MLILMLAKNIRTRMRMISSRKNSVFIRVQLCLSVVKMIHPTAIIHPQAKLGADVRVGAVCGD